MDLRDIAAAVQRLRPGAQFGVSGDTLADLDWLDQVQTKPSDTELLQAVTDEQAGRAAAAYKERRRQAYNERGATPDALTAALWEAQVEGDTVERDRLQAIRQQVKNEFPSPAEQKAKAGPELK